MDNIKRIPTILIWSKVYERKLLINMVDFNPALHELMENREMDRIGSQMAAQNSRPKTTDQKPVGKKRASKKKRSKKSGTVKKKAPKTIDS